MAPIRTAIGLTLSVLLTVAAVATADDTAADDDDVVCSAAKQKLLDRGYVCAPSHVELDAEPLVENVKFKGEWSHSTTLSSEVRSVWTAHNWGDPDDMDDVMVLRDGTICYKNTHRGGKFNATASMLAGIEASKDKNTTTARGLKTYGPELRKMLRSSPRKVLQFDDELTVPASDEEIRVPLDVSSEQFPFITVGRLTNGCSGALVGPCHYLTAGHCVFSPGSFSRRPGLDFTPGLNGLDSQPFDTFRAVALRASLGWTLYGNDYFDSAIVQVEGRPGDDLGFMELGAVRDSDTVDLNIAGYPGDKTIGQMWYDFCTDAELPFDAEEREHVFHDCKTTNGNSGSPMWTYEPEDDTRRIPAVHVGQEASILPVPFTDVFGNQRVAGVVLNKRPRATFIEGALLDELKAAIDDMECT